MDGEHCPVTCQEALTYVRLPSIDMAPFYELICEEQSWPVDASLLKKMKAENEEALKKLDDRLKDAEENLGETEISDTLLARAEHFARIGDKVRVSVL